MTPTQAATAAEFPDRFILCVVDLRGISQKQMESDWSADDVEPRTKIVAGIGPLVTQPHGLIVQAKNCQICIRNDTALRYGVPVQVWNSGTAIAVWVPQIKIPSTQQDNAPRQECAVPA
jgi:hypothetical protein